jgi:hypothetical protein
MTSFVRFSEIWRIRALAKWWAVGFHDFTFIVEPSGLLPKVATPSPVVTTVSALLGGPRFPDFAALGRRKRSRSREPRPVFLSVPKPFL